MGQALIRGQGLIPDCAIVRRSDAGAGVANRAIRATAAANLQTIGFGATDSSRPALNHPIEMSAAQNRPDRRSDDHPERYQDDCCWDHRQRRFDKEEHKPKKGNAKIDDGDPVIVSVHGQSPVA
jgi:hypothetical protein